MPVNKLLNHLRQPKNPWLVSLAGGCLAGVGFLTNLGVVSVVPGLGVLLINTMSQLSLRQLLVRLALFFAAFHSLVLAWFLDVNVASMMGLSSGLALFAQILALVLMTLVLTLPMLGLALAFHIGRRRNYWQQATIVISAWLVLEWLRSLTFSAFLMGQGGSIGDYWNFGSLGLSVIDTPWRYLASYIGLYGLTAVVLVLAFCVARLIAKPSLKLVVIAAVTLAVLSVPGFIGNATEPSATIEVSMLQQSLGYNDLNVSTPIDNYSSAAKELILLPEYSEVFEPGSEPFADRYVNRRLTEHGRSLDVNQGFADKWYGTLVLRDNTGIVQATATKQLLIPTGEYLPYIVEYFYKLTGQQAVLNNFSQNRQVEKGASPQLINTPSVALGAVACSGILGRNIYRDLVNQGAGVLTNSASLMDFNGSKSYFRQSLAMAKFHAIANQRTYIQSTAGAPSFVIDAHGDYVVKPADDRTKFIDFAVDTANHKSVYTRLGEWVLPGAAITLGACLLTFRPRIAKR